MLGPTDGKSFSVSDVKGDDNDDSDSDASEPSSMMQQIVHNTTGADRISRGEM